MEWKIEWRPLAWIVAGFLVCFWLPVDLPRFSGAVLEALYLVRDCEAPVGTCAAAATPEGDGVRLHYTALEAESLWLVCDSWDGLFD